MTKICDWCSMEIGEGNTVLPTRASEDQSADGQCPECSKKLALPVLSNVLEYLDGLETPVFLADGDARFIAANRKARRLAGGDPAEIEGWLIGDFFDCIQADLPGGCGKDECCRACLIRTAVGETTETGQRVSREPAYLDVKTSHGVQRKHYFVSTLKAGDAVLLRIDDE